MKMMAYKFFLPSTKLPVKKTHGTAISDVFEFSLKKYVPLLEFILSMAEAHIKPDFLQ